MKKTVCVGMLMALSSFGMELREVSEGERRSSLAIGQPRVESESEDALALRNIDVTCCLESSGKCCYAMQAVCRGGVGLCEVASLVLGGLCVTETKQNPDLAWGLALGGVISNAMGLGLTYALFKVQNKVRKLDKALGKARLRAQMRVV
jgi:hypothetical protein